MRCAREKRRRDLRGGVLGRKLHGKPLPTLLAPTAQDFAPPLRFHARAKPVRTDAALVAGAVGGLTHMRYVCETGLTGNATRGKKRILLTLSVSTP